MEFTKKEDQHPISDRRRVLEIVAVFVTGFGKFIFMDMLQWRWFFIPAAIIGWGVYVYYSYKRDKGILKYWGFRKDNFMPVVKRVLPFGLLAIVSFFAIGYWQGTLNLTWHIFPILITYPIWGVVQQFLIMSLVAGNLNDLRNKRINYFLIIVITALLFAFVHFPYYWLVLGTFVLAMFYAFIFLKQRNVYVLGLFHGWLGDLFFYTVVDRDPFLEMFGGLM